MSTTTSTTGTTTKKLLTEAAALRLPKRSKKAKDLHQIEGHLWLQHTGEAMSFVYMVNAKALQATRIEVGLGSWQVEGDSSYTGRVTRTWSDAKTRTVELDRELKKGMHPRDIERAFRESMKETKASAAPKHDLTAPPTKKQITVSALIIEFLENSSTGKGWTRGVAEQFRSTMRNYVAPLIGSKFVHDVTPDDVYRVLTQKIEGEDLWMKFHKQALVMRQRMEVMFDYAKAEKHRRSDEQVNPAWWQHFKHKLLSSAKAHVAKPRAHVKPEGIRAVWEALCENSTSQACVALRLKVLTVPRTTAIIQAQWSEFDFEKRLWSIPGERMKGDIQRKNIDFVIPLSTAAIALLQSMPGYEKRTGYLFPAVQKRRKQAFISQDAMRAQTYRMGYKGILTPHGMRHTFSTWRGEETEFSSELGEACLAHANGEGSKVAAAYNQATYVKRRAPVMQAWGEYVTGVSAADAEPLNEAAAPNVMDMTKERAKRKAA